MDIKNYFLDTVLASDSPIKAKSYSHQWLPPKMADQVADEDIY